MTRTPRPGAVCGARAVLTTHNGSINFEHFTACLGKFVQTDVSAFVEDKGGGIRSF